MPDPTLTRPAATEHIPYYQAYVSLVPGEDVMAALAGQIGPTLAVLRGIPEERGGFRYAPDKWSIKEMLGHVIDSERIFGYRALRFARRDPTPLPGYEQDDDIRAASFDACRLADLVDELGHVRQSTLSFFRHLAPEAWLRAGTANDNLFTVRALAWIIAGHEIHHVRVLRDRYL
jgi:DinB superfamily